MVAEDNNLQLVMAQQQNRQPRIDGEAPTKQHLLNRTGDKAESSSTISYQEKTMPDHALVFGINTYKHISNLRGCLNDVDNFKSLLTNTYAFQESSIRTYRDGDVTRAAIDDGFSWLYDGARSGDRLVVHFSGHGSYTVSSNDDEDIDELLCLYDMDWEEQNSYLIDDELGEFTRDAPAGVHLTIILDCCHSGTGTRAVTPKMKIARSAGPKNLLVIPKAAVSGMRNYTVSEFLHSLERPAKGASRSTTIDEEKIRDHAPLARFVAPPTDLDIPSRTSRVGALGRSIGTTMNHQLLAGAADNQTAADAYIAGNFNGAFSYYLCESARTLGPQQTSDKIMARVASELAGTYAQKPQSEGPFGSKPLFGGDAQALETLGESPLPAPTVTKQGEASSDGSGPRPLVILDRLLRVSERLLELDQPSYARVTKRTGARPEGIVYVHGISRHDADYSMPWYNALLPHLNQPLTRAEVLWSHHVNASRSEEHTLFAAQTEARQLREEIEEELESRTAALERLLPRGATRGLTRERGATLAIDDFVRYMVSAETRNAIKAEFDKVVRPLLLAGERLQIVSHSWGTVVAFEALRDMDDDSFDGSVENLFVVGSALSINTVRSNLFARIDNGRLPCHVGRMINLDAGGDIVGGPIDGNFAVAREYLGLKPNGCTTIPFTDIAINPGCAHSSAATEPSHQASANTSTIRHAIFVMKAFVGWTGAQSAARSRVKARWVRVRRSRSSACLNL